ncbi:hypothetical protein [uncultured Nitrosomonas sp.]|uniref:hypothetical protein n=1 Tax=uncultured Nitrosomonas sp. TaxID=156424 RepID=UPI0025EBDE4D|nr:hypothetical protein [uncultured Nitrosomonas sp.]
MLFVAKEESTLSAVYLVVPEKVSKNNYSRQAAGKKSQKMTNSHCLKFQAAAAINRLM